MSAPEIAARLERWPIARPFTISRGSKTEAAVVVCELTDGKHKGRGESVPYARYGETPESVIAAIEGARGVADRAALQDLLPPGAARNALDCALWDLEARREGRRAFEIAGLEAPAPVTATYTLSLDTPGNMAAAAAAEAHRPILKIKLGAEGDEARLAAVRQAAPNARLIVDANEGWTLHNLAENMAACARSGVELVEQPLPAADDAMLAHIRREVPVCADESVFDRQSLPGLAGKYDLINIKLDKCGGLTEALALAREARRANFGVMIGCMVCTSLAVAPAFLLARDAKFADLDGPLLLAQDRADGLRYEGGMLYPPSPELWG